MEDKNSLLLDEAITKISNNLESDSLEIKPWAEFAVVFYKKYKANYNERLLVKIIKEIFEFYRQNLEISSKREQIATVDDLLKKIDENKNSICTLYKLPNVENRKQSSEKLEYNKDQFKEWKEQLSKSKDENNALKEKRIFFFSKSRKGKKAKIIIENLEKLINEILDSTDETREEVEMKNKDILKIFENIKEDLKKFVSEVKKDIGVELADINYEYVISDINVVKDFIFNVIIQNLYFYFKNKNIEGTNLFL